MLIVSATSAGRAAPSTSTEFSEVIRTPPPSTGSTDLIFWRNRMREPAQCFQTPAAGGKTGLAAGKGGIVVMVPAFGQPLAESDLRFGPEQSLGGADIGLAQTAIGDERNAESLSDDSRGRPGAREIA